MKKYLIPFAGYPIFLIQEAYYLNNKELNYIKNLNYFLHPTEKNLKLSENQNILQLKNLKNLKKFIMESLDGYVSDILQIKNKFTFCKSWSTIQNEKAYHPAHSHHNHLISCVYYAKAKETKLTFNISKSVLQNGYYFSYDIKKYNVFNSKSYSVSLKTGDLIFFPGQLIHESSINDNNERIIVGSGFFIDGKLGSKKSFNEIDITINK